MTATKAVAGGVAANLVTIVLWLLAEIPGWATVPDEPKAAIIALEEERATLLAELGTEAVYRDPAALKQRQVRLAEIERDLEEKNSEWEQYV